MPTRPRSSKVHGAPPKTAPQQPVKPHSKAVKQPSPLPPLPPPAEPSAEELSKWFSGGEDFPPPPLRQPKQKLHIRASSKRIGGDIAGYTLAGASLGDVSMAPPPPIAAPRGFTLGTAATGAPPPPPPPTPGAPQDRLLGVGAPPPPPRRGASPGRWLGAPPPPGAPPPSFQQQQQQQQLSIGGLFGGPPLPKPSTMAASFSSMSRSVAAPPPPPPPPASAQSRTFGVPLGMTRGAPLTSPKLPGTSQCVLYNTLSTYIVMMML